MRSKRTLVLSALASVALIAGAALWMFWPLMVFFLGRPTFYRTDDPRLHARAAFATAILGATLVDGHGGAPVDNAAIVIRGERIVEVGKAGEVRVPPDAVQIQANGKTVLPGLIDMHV